MWNRDFLNKVNESNPNITSIPVQEIYYYGDCISKKKISIENVQYIDIGLEYLSFYVDNISIVSIRYSLISRLDQISNNSLKVIILLILNIFKL